MDNSSVVDYLNKQGGTRAQKVCALSWRIMAWTNVPGDSHLAKTHPRESQCSGRFFIQERQGDSGRMGAETSGVQSNLPLLASTNGSFVCNKTQSQVYNV